MADEGWLGKEKGGGSEYDLKKEDSLTTKVINFVTGKNKSKDEYY